MKIFKSKNGKLFRLAGLSITDRGDILTIFWLESQKYEEFFYSEVEPYLIPIEEQKEVIEEPKEIEQVEKPKEVKPKKQAVKKKPKESIPDLFAI